MYCLLQFSGSYLLSTLAVYSASFIQLWPVQEQPPCCLAAPAMGLMWPLPHGKSTVVDSRSLRPFWQGAFNYISSSSSGETSCTAQRVPWSRSKWEHFIAPAWEAAFKSAYNNRGDGWPSTSWLPSLCPTFHANIPINSYSVHTYGRTDVRTSEWLWKRKSYFPCSSFPRCSS